LVLRRGWADHLALFLYRFVRQIHTNFRSRSIYGTINPTLTGDRHNPRSPVSHFAARWARETSGRDRLHEALTDIESKKSYGTRDSTRLTKPVVTASSLRSDVLCRLFPNLRQFSDTRFRFEHQSVHWGDWRVLARLSIKSPSFLISVSASLDSLSQKPTHQPAGVWNVQSLWW
jgi:hypothetical protein